MSTFWPGVVVIMSLDLRQRLRGKAWYVLLGVFVGLVAIVTVLLRLALNSLGNADGGVGGGPIFSTVIYFVLLLGTLVAPALSGTAINGDREAGTLATTQVTLITTGQLLLGKFLAAWITALAFLLASLPFLIYAAIVGGLSLATMVVSTLVLIFELGIVAAIGVGLSGILARPLFSIVVSYLVIAALSIGTLIAFGLGGIAVQSEAVSTERSYIEQQPPDPLNPDAPMPAPIDPTKSTAPQPDVLPVCGPPTTNRYNVPRFDYFWGVLVANPYVALADAVPAEFDAAGQPKDLFGIIKTGVRSTQQAPDLRPVNNYCTDTFVNRPTSKEIVDSTVPGWAVGLSIQLVLALGALFWAYRRTRTPSGKLATGTRIA